MTSFSLADARNRFSDLVNSVAYAKERIVLTRRGKKVVAIVPVEDMELLERLEDIMDIREADKVMKSLGKTGKTIPWEDVKRELGL